MKTLLRKAAVGLFVALLGATVAQAAIISFGSRAAFDAAFPGSVVENWDSYSSGTTFPDGSTTNGITYNSSAGNALVTNAFVVSSSPNGLGDTGVGFFQASDTITFSFASGIGAFGIDINTFATAAGAYTATTSAGDVIGSVFDPFPGLSTGQFLGFSSDSPFTSVTIAAVTDVYTLDTLRAVHGVPEPGTLALLGFGLAGLAAARRRKQ